jgi:hypothetical protein
MRCGDNLVARLQKREAAPVAVAEWDDRLDARFPLQMLAGSADLCLVTNRDLPTPARPSGAPGAPGAISSARLRRTKIARVPWEATAQAFAETLQKMPAAQLKDAQEMSVPALKRGHLAPMDVEFARPTWPALKTSQREGAAQIGWLQVLAARVGTFSGEPPARAIRQEVPAGEGLFIHTTDDQIGAWTQSRRLVVPLRSQPGQKMRAEFPLTIEAYATDGLFEVWARLVRDKNDASTPWQRVDLIQLTHR